MIFGGNLDGFGLTNKLFAMQSYGIKLVTTEAPAAGQVPRARMGHGMEYLPKCKK